MTPLIAPMQALIVECCAAPGAQVLAGDVLLILEAMKMEHEIRAPHDGQIHEWFVGAGETVEEGAVMLQSQAVTLAAPAPAPTSPTPMPQAVSPTGIRPDLQRVIDRHALTLDAARPEAVAKRHALGQRTARENLADLVDEGSWVEYGALAIAAQTRRRSLEDLQANTPADGMVTGLGSINGQWFGPEASRCAVLAYDATVLAGTQGMRNHQKTYRLLQIAHAQSLPVVLWAAGGGGRPGDVDVHIVAGLQLTTFASYARLSGRVPVVGITSGRCFAGNAALLGCSDVIIATRGSNIGMGGPAMVEGGGLGQFKPEDIGPSAPR